MSQEALFDPAAEDFLAYEESVPGQLRYTLARENLGSFLPSPPAQILDIGGGSGPDAAWLASLGHNVSLVEPSQKQLDLAARRFKNLDTKTTSKIETIRGDIESLNKNSKFDVVISHVVASYLNDPLDYWQGLVQRLGSGGILSILENGEIGGRKLLERRNKTEELREFRRTGKYINNIGLEVRTFTFSQIEQTLKKLGMKLIFQAGIRIEANHIRQPVDAYGKDRFQQLLAKERILSKDPTRMHEASLLQVIAQKI